MRYYTCDTSTIVSRKLTDLPNNFVLSGVVLLELMASATDESERRGYEAIGRDYQKDSSLIVPEQADWVLAGKVLYWLTRERRRAGKGRAPRLAPGASQRMALDALIATSARRWSATVITGNGRT
jgi:hypothetical protein